MTPVIRAVLSHSHNVTSITHNDPLSCRINQLLCILIGFPDKGVITGLHIVMGHSRAGWELRETIFFFFFACASIRIKHFGQKFEQTSLVGD